jgi:hypothetical protein
VSRQKVLPVWGGNPKYKRRNLFQQDNCEAFNEVKNNKQQRVKKLGGLGWQPQEYFIKLV